MRAVPLGPGAILREGSGLHLQQHGDGPEDAHAGWLLDADRRRRAVCSSRARGSRPRTGFSTPLRGDHHVLSTAPVELQEGGSRGRGRPWRSRPHGGQARGVDRRLGDRAEHVALEGGIRETQEMLDYCAAHEIAADVEVIPIQKINEAYERMLRNDVHYRFVIDIASLA